MKKNLTIIIVLAVIIGLLLLVGSIRKPKPPSATTKQIWQQTGVPVETAAVTRGDMDDLIEITGDLNALNTAVISSKISGRLVSVRVHEGDHVSKGQVIAVLDQGDAQSNLEAAQASLQSARAKLAQAVTNAEVTKIQTNTAITQARASLRSAEAQLILAKNPSRSQERTVAKNKVNSAKAQLDNAEADYKRYERLLNRGAISASDYDVKKSNYLVALANYNSAKEDLSLIDEGGRKETVNSVQSQVDVAKGSLRDALANSSENRIKAKDITAARAEVQEAQASVDTARRQLSDTYIKSPISGTISSRSADPGKVVSSGQEIANVVDLSSVYFKGDVSEQYMAKISKGQSVNVTIDAMSGTVFHGSIAEIYPSGSTSNRNFAVRISISKPSNKIKPGMFASGEILAGVLHNVLLVPKDAVDDQEGTQSVFVEQANKIAKRHIVTVLKTNTNFAQIAAPTDLKIGDQVVTQGRKNIQDGSKLELSHQRRASNVAN